MKIFRHRVQSRSIKIVALPLTLMSPGLQPQIAIEGACNQNVTKLDFLELFIRLNGGEH